MKIEINMKPTNQIIKKILNDSVGKFLAETWGKIFSKYTPKDTGTLSQQYTTEPWKVIYHPIYSHYQWEGVSKSGIPLNYGKEENFLAQSHWEEAAFKDKSAEVAQAVTEYLKKR